MRGAVHVGVYRALKERYGSLTFPDGIYGCSIGCMFALAAAYDLSLNQVETLCYKYLSMDSVVDRITLDNVQSLFEQRGLISTDTFTTTLAAAFDECGIDLRTKTVDDLPQKVFFVSSNLTTGRASLLTGSIPVLKAVACSVCIPFFFIPEVLNGHVHLDGGIYARCLRDVVPSNTLVVHISRPGYQITPTQGSMLEMLGAMMQGVRSQYYGPNVLRINNSTLSMLETPTDEQKKAAIEEGYSQACAFFAKRLTEELQ